MLKNPTLYEINTRVWLKQFGKNATLADVPFSYFQGLNKKGIELVWLMGIWTNCPDIVEKCCFTNELTSVYSKCLEDWKKEDVVGSPYSVDAYEVNPLLGTKQDILKLKKQLNENGMKLILDFVPNHFGAGTKYLKTNPEIFLQTDEDSLQKDSYTFFKQDNYIFAHGRDPLFPAWTDTVQVNFFSNEAREYLTNILLQISEICDGARCDMAMLAMNNVFYNTWIGVHNKNNVRKPDTEFWKESIQKVREKKEDFIFISEVYWGLEWELQQLGFDFTYDKRLLERLLSNDIMGVKAHLNADKAFQEKSVRFIENHDEHRAVTSFGKMRSLAAATVMSTVMGMKLFYDGQFSGKRIKLSVQLAREPEERPSKTVSSYYDKLLNITSHEVFKQGEWTMLEPMPVDPNNNSCDYLFTWQWKLKNEIRLIIINYSDSTAQCRLKFNIKTDKKKLGVSDLLNNKKYIRSVDEIQNSGLFIELKAFSSHIFAINL